MKGHMISPFTEWFANNRIAAGGDGEEEDAPEATRTTYDEADAIDFM